MHKFITRLVFLFSVIIFTASINAQVTTSGLFGAVSDNAKDAVPGANVVAIHTPTGTIYGSSTRADGNYNIYGLRPGGPYKITVSVVGKKKVELQDIYFDLGQNLRLDFVMVDEAVQIGEVQVTAQRSAVLGEDRTGADKTVSEYEIETLPTISRRFQDFSKLSPLFSGTDLSAAGRISRYNNIQIDGAQYNDLFGLGNTGTPGGQVGANPISLDAIQEFQIVVAPYDIRMSGFTGGGINAITRSGDNFYKGSIYGYGRNQSFVGKTAGVDDSLRTAFPDFKEYQYGARFGMPVIKDKLFFFTNVELTTYNRPSTNISLVGNPTARAYGDTVAQILSSRGLNVGTADEFTLDRPSTKVFARIDWNLSENHRVTLRNNYVKAADDILGNRNRNNALSFSSFNYRIDNTTNSTVLQWNSTYGNNMSNEFIAGFTTIRDKRAGTSAASPEIEVRAPGVTITAGPDRFSSANALDQDVFELTNNFTYVTGRHVLTFGTHNEFFSFKNTFIRSFYGYYVFNSINDLRNSNVGSYQRSYARSGDSPSNQPAAEFSVYQFGLYAQDEWTVNEDLKLTIGVRADMPVLPDSPAKNDSVSKYFPGYQTDKVPSGKIMFSPRIGFNLRLASDRSSQLRGGIGVFTGRTPYVWMSNNYGNSGTLLADLSVSGAAAAGLRFSLDPNNQPKAGEPGTGTPSTRSEINLVDPDFMFPQILRFNVGYDRALPFGFVGSFEFIYSKSLNEVYYEKLNIRNLDNPTSLASESGRLIYGGTDSKNNNFTDVLSLRNSSDGYQYNFVVQVQRQVPVGLSANFGYSFGASEDVNSTTSSQAVSQMRFNPIAGNPNTPPLSRSLYEIRHRLFLSLSYAHEFFKNAPTTISLYYNGQSGAPFSFIVNGDVNSDGFNQNDLFYIPKDQNDILLGSISGGNFVANNAMYAQLEDFIANNEYLSSNRGKMSTRNGAINPWRNILDFRIAQDVPTFAGQKLTISLDILNVLNLISNDWGLNETVFSTYNTTNLVGTLADGRKVYSFTKPATNTPWAIEDITSRWAMQLGVRYTF